MPSARVGTFESPRINSKAAYRVQVSGQITDAPTTGDSVVQGGTVLEGTVFPPGGADSFSYTGDIVAFDSSAALTLQGASVSTSGTNSRNGNRDGDSSTPTNQRDRSQGGGQDSGATTPAQPPTERTAEAPVKPAAPVPANSRSRTTNPAQSSTSGGGFLGGLSTPAIAAGGLGIAALLYTISQ